MNLMGYGNFATMLNCPEYNANIVINNQRVFKRLGSEEFSQVC